MNRILPRLLIGAATAVPLSWFVLAVTAAGVFREQLPQYALTLAPFDARAQGALAQQLVAGPPASRDLARARGLARSALRRDPTAVDGATSLGLVALLRNRASEAEQAFEYTAALSRRDVPSQLWLLERAVARNDIPAALAHYDTVLRTSPRMHALLLPVLVRATTSRPIAAELNKLLMTKPIWLENFISSLVVAQADPRAIFYSTRGVLDRSDPRERELLQRLLSRLTALQAFDYAWEAYAAAVPERRNRSVGLWNGGFAEQPGLPPFDWTFTDDPAMVPERRRVDAAGNYGLFLPSGATSRLEAARQLIRLPAGRYDVSARVGNVSGESALRPELALRCAGEHGQSLVGIEFPEANAQGAGLAAQFSVPTGCRYQWISIWIRGAFDRPSSDTPWIGSIRIRELRPAQQG